MAEVIFRHMLERAGRHDIEVFSRGVAATPGTPMTGGAQAALEDIGLSGQSHRAERLHQTDLERADLVLVMEDIHLHVIQQQFPQVLAKSFLLKAYAGAPAAERELADPYGGSHEDYEKCRMEIRDALLGLLSKLQVNSERTPS